MTTVEQTTAIDYSAAVNELHEFGPGYRLGVHRDGTTGSYLATDEHQLTDTTDMVWCTCGHRTAPDGRRRGEPWTLTEDIAEYFA